MKKRVKNKRTGEYEEIDVPYDGPRMPVPGEHPDETIYIAKRVYEGLLKKANVTHTEAKGRSLFIHYRAKKGSGQGVLELYDLGP